MTAREGVTYCYDANGNTLSKASGASTCSTGGGGGGGVDPSYAWDFENRLVGVALPASGGSISMKYDPFGRRIYKNAPAGTTIYVYDGNNSIEELSGTGALQERYTYGPGIDEPLVGQRQPKIFYYEADGLGSITSLTDPTGAVAATYTYDSFGFLTNSTGSATNWFRYTARQFDSDTALYNYRARYYDPTTGRFLSEDPARFDAGINFYSYALNSPISWKDPSGRNVTVYYYPGSPLNPFGHVGLAVNDNPSVGFYPLVDLLPTNVAYGPGIVKADTQTPTNWVTVPTTPEQDAAIQQYINSHGGFSNGNYSFVSRNCTRFVEKALAAGGVASSNTAYPRTLIQDLNDLYNPPVLVPLNVQQQLDNPGLFYLSQ
jgi:RHS repeat-associated protein